MRMLRMPKTIRWIISCACLLLLIMSFYRLGIYLFFKADFANAKTGMGKALWYGFRFDARVAAIISLLILLLSFWPGLHIFRWAGGKRLAIGLYGLCMAIILFFCVADIGYLFHFNARLQGTLISDLAKGTEKWQVFRSDVPWFLLFLGLMILVSGFIFLTAALHHHIGKLRGTDDRSYRIFWQYFFALICLFAVYGQFAFRPLTVTNIAKEMNAAQLQLALNPFESLYNSLPVAKNKDIDSLHP